MWAYRPSSRVIRVAAITDLLSQGVPMEDVQYLAGHADRGLGNNGTKTHPRG